MVRIRVPFGARLGIAIAPVIVGIAACAAAAAPIETSPAPRTPAATTVPAASAPAGSPSPTSTMDPAASAPAGASSPATVSNVPDAPIPPATSLTQLEAYATDFPQGLAIAFDSIWTTNEQLDTVTRIQPTSGRVTAIHVGATGEPAIGPQGIAAAGNSIWAAGAGGLVRIDPDTNAVTARINGKFGDLQAAFDSVWAGGPGAVMRIDPGSGKVLATVEIGGQDFCFLSVAAGSVWSGCGQDLYRVDPASNAVSATISDVGHQPAVVGDGGAAWVMWGRDPFSVSSVDEVSTTIQRLDTTTNRLIDGSAMRLVQGASVGGRLVDGASVWLSTTFGTGTGAGRLYRFDPASGAVTAAFDVSEGKGYGANAVKLAYGSVWLASGTANAVRRLPEPPLP
jgi:hypothetical protein